MTTPDAIDSLLKDCDSLINEIVIPSIDDPLFKEKLHVIFHRINDFYVKNWYTLTYINDYANEKLVLWNLDECLQLIEKSCQAVKAIEKT